MTMWNIKTKQTRSLLSMCQYFSWEDEIWENSHNERKGMIMINAVGRILVSQLWGGPWRLVNSYSFFYSWVNWSLPKSFVVLTLLCPHYLKFYPLTWWFYSLHSQQSFSSPWRHDFVVWVVVCPVKGMNHDWLQSWLSFLYANDWYKDESATMGFKRNLLKVSEKASLFH